MNSNESIGGKKLTNKERIKSCKMKIKWASWIILFSIHRNATKRFYNLIHHLIPQAKSHFVRCFPHSVWNHILLFVAIVLINNRCQLLAVRNLNVCVYFVRVLISYRIHFQSDPKRTKESKVKKKQTNKNKFLCIYLARVSQTQIQTTIIDIDNALMLGILVRVMQMNVSSH